MLLSIEFWDRSVISTVLVYNYYYIIVQPYLWVSATALRRVPARPYLCPSRTRFEESVRLSSLRLAQLLRCLRSIVCCLLRDRGVVCHPTCRQLLRAASAAAFDDATRSVRL